LAARAARAGQSLQAYRRARLIELAAMPIPEELWTRVRARVQATGTTVTTEQILEALDHDKR
jgi:hypothetical protein